MNKGLMKKFAEWINYNHWPFGDYVSCIYDQQCDDFDGYDEFDGSILNTRRYDFVCTRKEYEEYIKQHNESSSPNTVTEAFQLLETLAEQSNYDINITSVGTVIYDETGDEIRGTPEQLYKILEAQIHLRDLIKEVTGE